MKKHYLLSLITSSILLISGCGDSTTVLTPEEETSLESPSTINIPNSTVNSVPVATYENFSINTDTVFNGQLTAKDADADIVKYILGQNCQYGTVTINKNGTFTYTPIRGHEGKDSFTYRVEDELSTSPYKTVVINVEKASQTIPNPPTNLRLEALSTCKIKISWDDNSNNETGFEIYQNSKLATVVKENTVTTNICGGMAPATEYSITVKSKNIAGSSLGVSGIVTTKDITKAPEAPTRLRASAVEKTSVRLVWEDNAWSETEYDIYVNGVWHKVIDANCNCTVITGLDEGTEYTFQVTAKNKIGGSPSNIFKATTESDLIMDRTLPVITLLGEATVSIAVGDIYIDAGATASDNIDGDITSLLEEAVSTVDVTQAGEYTVTYRVRDAAGNRATQIRVVRVTAAEEELPAPLFEGEFAKIKTLLLGAQEGTISDVTYITVGDSTRAIGDDYNGGELFGYLKSTLDTYHVNSILQAKAGHTVRKWNNYDGNTTLNAPTWEDTVAAIPNDGNTTIVSISLGINDARYYGDGGEKEKIRFHMDGVEGAMDKILAQRPNVSFLLTMPHKLIGLDIKMAEIKEAYEEIAAERGIPLINTVDALFAGEEDLSLYRDEDATEYGEDIRIHLSSQGQVLVSDYILSIILP